MEIHRTFPALQWYSRTGFEFRKQNGEFEFIPTRGVLNIRGSYNYVSKNRAKAIQNGDVPGIIIKESGTGKIVIQESRQTSNQLAIIITLLATNNKRFIVLMNFEFTLTFLALEIYFPY